MLYLNSVTNSYLLPCYIGYIAVMLLLLYVWSPCGPGFKSPRPHHHKLIQVLESLTLDLKITHFFNVPVGEIFKLKGKSYLGEGLQNNE